MNEALRLADALDYEEFDVVEHGKQTAAELRRLYDLHGKANALCRIRAARIKELEALNAELMQALSFIAVHDLRGTGLEVAGHMAHGFIGRARAVLAKVEASNES